MHRSIAGILIFLAGWTLASNILFFAGGSLDELILVGPIFIASLAAIYLKLPNFATIDVARQFQDVTKRVKPRPATFLVAAAVATLLLRFNWMAFWVASVILLATHCFHARRLRDLETDIAPTLLPVGRVAAIAVLATMAAAAATALAVNRPDLDDALYVGIAAFTHAHPKAALLATDPMYGEPGWPLLFPSYRFASFELLAAALAKLFDVSAMDVMYRILPPLGAAFVALSAFFLSRQMTPRRWLLMGLITVAFGLVLGECHRSFGNFMFVRIFQGKSIYVSALMPLIFALAFRCVSQQGSSRDVMLSTSPQF